MIVLISRLQYRLALHDGQSSVLVVVLGLKVHVRAGCIRLICDIGVASTRNIVRCHEVSPQILPDIPFSSY